MAQPHEETLMFLKRGRRKEEKEDGMGRWGGGSRENKLGEGVW